MEEIKCEHEEVCGCCDVDHEECEYFAPKIDREALLSVCSEIEDADVDGFSDWPERIRKAIGEEVTTTKEE